ncbi:U32 family peptidase, partial [bacterium]|nr:U32 family peptidase [bacterium]
LKDFNASGSIEKLILSGVKSFKIEGRLKDVNYVKNVTLYYNNLINCYAQRTSSGKVFTDVKPDLNKTFNRSYTDYFLNGRSDCYNFSSPKFVGEKVGKVLKSTNNYFMTDALLNPQDGICYEENGEYKGFLINKIADGKVYPNTPVCVPQNTVLYRNYDAEFYNNLCNSKIIRKIGVSFKISKGIIYAEDEDGNIVSVKISSDIKSNNPEKMCNNYMSQLSRVGESDFTY